MRPETLLHNLGEAVRAEELEDEELLEAYCRGELSPEELRELDARAALDGAFAERRELFRPLEAAECTRLLDRLPAPKAPKAARLKPLLLAAPLAVAAGLALLVRQGPDPQRELPSYSLEVKRTQKTERSQSVGTPSVLRLDRAVAPVFLLRPATKVVDPVDALLLLDPSGVSSQDSALRSWEHRVERDPGGGMRIVLGDLAKLPQVGLLVLCVFDPRRGTPTAARLEQEGRCSSLFRLKYELQGDPSGAP